MKTRRVLFVPLFFTLLTRVQTLPYSKSVAHCEQYLDRLDCYYFACIDAIYQCGVKNLLVQFSYHFCEVLLERTYSSLTPSAQTWAKATHQCLMREIQSYFQSNASIMCNDIDRSVLSKYPACLARSHPNLSLCSIMCNNLEIFLRIFHQWNMDAFSFNRLFADTSALCPERSLMRETIDLKDTDIRMMLWSLCLDTVKNDLRDFQANQVMIETKDQSGLFGEHLE